ncbi:MAG: terminase [Thermoanaerobaculia bacterium]
MDALVPQLLHIRDRRGQLVDLRPNAAQREYVRRRTRRNIILKARQVGLTTYIAARFFLATILRPGTVTLQVAHTLESAQQIFRIVHRFVEHLGPTLGHTLETSRANVREIAFAAMDSRYIVDTAGNRHAGRGLTIHNLHASEVALWPGQPQETMAALLAAVPSEGCVDVESTPHGVGGYFHTEWLRAERNEGFTPHFFPWWIEPAYRLPLAPGETLEPLSPEELLLRERHGLTREHLTYRRHLHSTYGQLAQQEFAESSSECFLVSGRPVFDLAAIGARLRRLTAPLRTEHNDAKMVWLEPQPGRRYLIGADVAEGGEHGDFSAAVVIDADIGLECAELFARWPIHRFAQELVELGRRYNNALMVVERNNQGLAVLYALEHEFGYGPIYRQTGAAGNEQRLGWLTNAQTKPLAIRILETMLREAPEAFSSARLLEQCRSYAYLEKETTGARPGTHDDLVMAMAIALAVRAHSTDIQLLKL